MGRLSYLPKLCQGGLAFSESTFGCNLNKARFEVLSQFSSSSKNISDTSPLQQAVQLQRKNQAGSDIEKKSDHHQDAVGPAIKTEYWQPPVDELPHNYDTVQRFAPTAGIEFVQKIMAARMPDEHLVQPGGNTYGHRADAVYKHAVRQPFLPVDLSPWTLIMGVGVMNIFLGIIYTLHAGHPELFLLGLGTGSYALFFWVRDVTREATFMGYHTLQWQQAYRFGMLLFLFSEFFFFFTIFWTWFSNSNQVMFKVMPEELIIKGWGIPLLNTFILLSSGATLTWSHHAMIAAGNYARRTPK